MPIVRSSILPSSPLRQPPVCAANFEAPYAQASGEPKVPQLDGFDGSTEPQRKKHRRTFLAARVIPLSRKLHTESALRLTLGRVRMTEKMAELPRAEDIEATRPVLWRTLVTMHEGVASRLFWPMGVQNGLVMLKVSQVRLLLTQFSNVQVVHHLYWLLMSPQGPRHLVALTPRAEHRVREFFNTIGMTFANRYLDESRYRARFRASGVRFEHDLDAATLIAAVLRATREESEQENHQSSW